jgi:hypothetical protein
MYEYYIAKKTHVLITAGKWKGFYGWMKGEWWQWRRRCAEGDTQSVIYIEVFHEPTATYFVERLALDHNEFELAQMELPLDMPPLNTALPEVDRVPLPKRRSRRGAIARPFRSVR